MIVSSSMASDIVEVLREFSDLQVEGTQSRMWLDAGLQRQALLVDQEISPDLPSNDYYEYFAPDFRCCSCPADHSITQRQCASCPWGNSHSAKDPFDVVCLTWLDCCWFVYLGGQIYDQFGKVRKISV